MTDSEPSTHKSEAAQRPEQDEADAGPPAVSPPSGDEPESPTGSGDTESTKPLEEPDGEAELEAPDLVMLEAFGRIAERMRDDFDALAEAFERRAAQDTFREQQVRTLHQELQQYRRDLVEQTARPLINGMIQIHDDAGTVLRALAEEPPEELTTDRLLGLLESFHKGIEIVLAQNGIDAYSEPGDEFDPRRQKIIDTVPTTDEQQCGHVADHVRSGFERGDRILLKERVAIYSQQAPPPGTKDTPTQAPEAESEPTEPPQDPDHDDAGEGQE